MQLASSLLRDPPPACLLCFSKAEDSDLPWGGGTALVWTPASDSPGDLPLASKRLTVRLLIRALEFYLNSKLYTQTFRYFFVFFFHNI